MQTSASSPETETTERAETRQSRSNELETVLDLLSGKPDGDEGGESVDETTTDEKPETATKPRPETLEAVAERLGVEVSELYKVKVRISEGSESREVTLGELKDQNHNASSFAVEKLEWEENRTKREHELVKTQQTIADIVALLPKSAVTPQLKETLTRRRAEMVAREKELTRGAIPEWIDDAVEAQDRAAMGKHLEEYGFPRGYIDSIHDHKTLRYVRESMRREARIAAALEQVKTARKPGHKPSATPAPGQGRKAAPGARGPARSMSSAVDKVTALLDGIG